MTEQDALAELTRRIVPSEIPTIGTADVTAILGNARRADSEGRSVDDPEWVPTWDLDAAAAEGWAVKAGKAANLYSFTEDGQRFDRAAIYRHCIEQSRLYGRRLVGFFHL